MTVLIVGACASPKAPPPPPPVLQSVIPNSPPPEPRPAPEPENAPASPEQQSLAFARHVLEREADGKLSDEQREAVARALVRGESEYALPVVLVLAIMRQESRFDPAARGPAGSIGLMQLQPATAREIALRNDFDWHNKRTLLDPEKNAQIGLAYLAQMRRKFGTTEHAVAAYNIGPANLRRLLARGPLRRGPYLTKIYRHVDALREKYGE